MCSKSKFAIIFVILFLSSKVPAYAKTSAITDQQLSPQDLVPADTVIVSNESDARFGKDFSVLLKHLKIEWVILDEGELPVSIHNKNIILIGHPDSEITGPIFREILSEAEFGNITAQNALNLLIKPSPWNKNRTVFIGSGRDSLQRRDAAEELIKTIITDSPPSSQWITTTYDIQLTDNAQNEVANLQYQINDQEIPLQNLMFDVAAKSPRHISPEQAIEDADRFFYLLSHGYAGYGFIDQNLIKEAKNNIHQAIYAQPTWSNVALSKMIHDQLFFISDCHMNIGEYRFCDTTHFWYENELGLMLGDTGLQFLLKNKKYRLIRVNNDNPAAYLYPSLNSQGLPIYRLGILSSEKPAPLLLRAVDEEKNIHEFKVNLHKSNFQYYADDIFDEDIMAGIPVLRIRSFSDNSPEKLNQFIESANHHRGAPVLILDLRGNSGGNERWASNWIQGMTGNRPESIFITSELESKTSMIGRANAFTYYQQHASDPSLFIADANRYFHIAESYENNLKQVQWTALRYPRTPFINNETTIIVITNNLVASAGEGFVMRISQAENVVVVGENTMGALTFGNVSLHQLPNSKIEVWMSINFNIFPDLESREAIGLTPDLWVPAADAVNYTISAIRQGTITTYGPIPQLILTEKFVPESKILKLIRKGQSFWIMVLAFFISGIVWAYFSRKKPRNLLVAGLIWFISSIFTIRLNNQLPFIYGLFFSSIILIPWGVIGYFREKKGYQPDDSKSPPVPKS